jgi:hypothetical protein
MILFLVTIFVLVVYKHVWSFLVADQRPLFAKFAHLDLVIFFKSIKCLKSFTNNINLSLSVLNLLHILKQKFVHISNQVHLMNHLFYHDFWSFIVATLVLGSRPRQGFARVWAKREARELHFVLLRMQRLPRELPLWGVGVPVDSWIFREQSQGSKLIGLRHSSYHWKALGT